MIFFAHVLFLFTIFTGEVVDMIERKGKNFTDYKLSELDRLFEDIPAEVYTHSGGGSGTSPTAITANLLNSALVVVKYGFILSV